MVDGNAWTAVLVDIDNGDASLAELGGKEDSEGNNEECTLLQALCLRPLCSPFVLQLHLSTFFLSITS